MKDPTVPVGYQTLEFKVGQNRREFDRLKNEDVGFLSPAMVDESDIQIG